MSIPQSFLQELLSRVDIVDVVGRYVQLKKGGANLMGLCPFHGEKSPSFSVSPAKQFYHCFGCGKNGNSISFLMEHTGMGFVEAVHDLAQQTGLQVPEDDLSPQQKEQAAAQRQKQATLTDVLEHAAQAYRRLLRGAQSPIAYLRERGVSGEVARAYGVGYAPEGWRNLASVFAQYDDPLLEESGLVITHADDGGKRYDRFRDRVMFPIRNVKGECIGFGGRVLGDDKPKYLNSPETPVFHKGRELYGLFEARTAIREQGYVLVTEGYMDVLALAQRGFANTVATLGTACTPEHVAKLFRFTDTVVFSFDGDTAGQRAAHKALEGALPYATDTRSIKFLFLPPEHDPDSFIRSHGSDAFARLVAGAQPLSQFLCTAAAQQCDLTTPEGRARMSSHAAPLWAALPEGAFKRQMLGDLAAQAQLTPAELLEDWQNASHRAAGHKPPPPPGHTDALVQRRKGPARTSAARPTQTRRSVPVSRADHAIRLLLAHMAFFDELSHEHLAALHALGPPYSPLLAWLEEQFHEHGPQTWAVLHQRLQDHEGQALAEQLMSGTHAQAEGDVGEWRHELHDLLNRLLVEQLGQQATQALAAAMSDPAQLQHYRTLDARRRDLLEKLNRAGT
ncbi:DNA primase [Giesbergeria anulus]|uniref:DNA primase n=1 Tax=Giesbergeria anulus TaxID=180197 RepID=A0A1H9PBB5_9BURK|nr:DNA primase [Giesbergeria anulus]SER45478.1 DNA primase [Giesbergeria anulus]